MITIRALNESDVEHIRQLHEKYYPQFEFPDFFKNFLGKFAVIDEHNEIIIAGGVRPIAESILITDQSKSRIKIGRALVESQKFSLYCCSKFGIDELHAFVDNDEYKQHLIQHGFSKRSTCLSMRLSNG